MNSLKKLWLLLFVSCGCLIFPAGMAGAAEDAGDGGLPAWTVMFYMCGSDLESRYGYATGNLAEIVSVHDLVTLYEKQADKSGTDDAGVSREVNVVLQTGGCKKWHNGGNKIITTDTEIRTDVLQRWYYDPYEDPSSAEIRLQQELPLESMSDPETLSGFIEWSAREYPAEKYMLVLWDHGGGSRTGIFVDELFDGDIMYLYELGQALEDGGVTMEAVLFDACLMANLETACMIDDYAHWMIASEEVVTGQGTAISEWLKELCTRPDMDGSRLGRIICDTAQEKCAFLGDEQGAQLLTWSVIDLSRIQWVAASMEEVFQAATLIYKEDPEKVSQYMKQRNLAEKYGSYEDKMTDLYDVVVQAPVLDENSARMRNEILDKLEDAVVYCVRGSGRAMSRGLSYCFAAEMTDEELDIYARNCPSPHYLALLDAITPWSAPDSLYDEIERLPDINDLDVYDIVVERRLGEDGVPGIAVVGDDINVNGINCAFYRLDEETGNRIFLGYVSTDEGMSADGQTQRVIADPFRWPCVGEEFCSIGLIENIYGESLYEIPVQIDSDIWRFRCGYAPGKGYEIYGVWEGYNSSTNMFNRNVLSLSSMSGQRYRLLYPTLDAGSGLQGGGFEYSAEQTMARTLPVETRILPPGTYYIQYVVEDIFMRRIPMERAEVRWDGEKVTLAEGTSWEGTETLRWSIQDSDFQNRWQ